MTPEALAVVTVLVQVFFAGFGGLFMWAINSKFNSQAQQSENNRKSIGKLFEQKVDKESCQDHRDNCPGKQRAVA